MTFTPPERTDIVVVGGGPAGASAAQAAAEAGREVVLIEAKTHVGERCHCAEWVPALLARETDIPRRVRRSRAAGLEIRAGDESETVETAGFVIDRPAWEKGLLAAAAQAGALIVAGTRVEGWDGRGVSLKGPFGRRTIAAQALVAADGALSKLAAAVGLGRLEGVGGVQVEVDLKTETDRGLVAFRPDLLGYAWLFPKAGTANLGLGGRSLGRKTLSAMLGEWWAALAAEGLVGRSVFRRGGGFIPVGGMRDRIAFERDGRAVLLAGDAAGLTHPLTGAGIPQAVISGRLAGTAAAEFAAGRGGALDEYRAEVESRWGGYLSRGLARRRAAAGIWNHDFSRAVREYWPLWPKKGRRRAA